MEPQPARAARHAASARSGSSTCALRLEGLLRNASKHAAGIVIAPQPLTEDLPLWVDKDGAVVTQYTFTDVEAIGLIKFDFLGLKTLTLIDEHRAPHPRGARRRRSTLDALPLDDARPTSCSPTATRSACSSSNRAACGACSRSSRPTCFADLIAALALYRPGPARQRHGRASSSSASTARSRSSYLHPALEPILRDTYGVIVYQEQVMQIAQALAGYTLGDADNLRRAMGKKKAEEMAQGARALPRRRGRAGHRPTKLAGEIFDQMETFAAYGFNKCHSAAYALITYQTAYLKAHYPRRVHGRPAVARDGRHRQHLQEHRRVPRARHRASCRPT